MPQIVQRQILTFPPDSGEYAVLVDRVVDGDTVAFSWLVKGQARLFGVNTPEVTGATREAGLAAAAQLRAMIPAGGVVRAKVHGEDKYGRTLLTLFDAEGKSINERLILSGHAKVYLP
ncbi:MAG: thermonuclease family protein [Desulfurellales bacterium]|nr:MAG: thermonuclease family protein [Desulfurellales bacterium]